MKPVGFCPYCRTELPDAGFIAQRPCHYLLCKCGKPFTSVMIEGEWIWVPGIRPM